MSCVCFCEKHLAPALPPNVCPAVRQAPADEPLSACALSVRQAGKLSARSIVCQTLLLPDGSYHPVWKARQAVSYGLSGRSTLTFSGMTGRNVVCLQRALFNCRGELVEPQELTLPMCWQRYAPMDQLLLAGLWLLEDCL